MNQKNKSSKRNFIPQAIGDTIKKINKNFSSKFNKIEFIIHSHWSEIAGSYFTDYSEPKNITRIPDYENEIGQTIYKNYLNVSVAPAAAVEFQHFKDTILENINSFFGYKAIIDIKIKQNYISNSNANTPKKADMIYRKLDNNDEKKISKQVKDLNNKELKKYLIDLGKNITKEIK